jgi:hypothetical protein
MLISFIEEYMKTKITKLDVTKSIITHADSLAQRHALYVNDFVTRANTELYEILAEIHKLYEQVEGSKQRDRLVKSMRERLKSSHNIKTQANTKTTALIAKYVTRASRKTAHVYSRVLEVAIANHIGSADLVDYIKRMGGIDKVRMAVNSAETVAQAKATEKNYVQQLRSQLAHKQGIGSVDLSAIAHTVPHACDVEFTHVLCRFNSASNQREVVAVMYPSSALETQAMQEYLCMLNLAAASDTNSFYDKCKAMGVNMDVLMRWMAANNIHNADTARVMARALIASANQAINSSSAAPMLLAA